MTATLTDRLDRHNLEVTEQAFGNNEGRSFFSVIARSVATKQSILSFRGAWIASLRSQ
jgi:hypothetical protein